MSFHPPLLAYYLAYFLPQLYRKICEIQILFQMEKAGTSQMMHRLFPFTI